MAERVLYFNQGIQKGEKKIKVFLKNSENTFLTRRDIPKLGYSPIKKLHGN
jgi:hypothetical protein